METIDTEIKNLVAEILEQDPSSINPEARLVEDLGMDSMMALEILVAIEKKFKITIPEEKLAELKSLNATIAVAKEYINAAKPAATS